MCIIYSQYFICVYLFLIDFFAVVGSSSNTPIPKGVLIGITKVSNQIKNATYIIKLKNRSISSLNRLNPYRSMPSNKPFIIKSKIVEPMLPTDSDHYDEVQQSRIQILQAINGYLAVQFLIQHCKLQINMLYQSFKLMWSFWHYKTECPDYAYLSLGFMGSNIIWAIVSFWGFRSIRSKNSRNIKIFAYVVIVNFVIRVIMYSVCGAVMHGYVPNYVDVTPQELNNIVCNALYPEALYVIQGVFEGLISLLILFLAKSVFHYVRRWERSETEKYQPQRLNNLSDY